MATQAERSRATRQAILNVAIQAFLVDGLGVSIDAIAAQAGVTKGTVLYHFGGRNELLRAVASAVVAGFERRFRATEASGDVRSWVRVVLEEQASPSGRMLFSINNELAAAGELAEVHPFPYIVRRLTRFGIAGSPRIVAAAMIQLGNQLAFGSTDDTIDDVMHDLIPLL